MSVTYYRWWKEYGGIQVDQLKPLKELEKQNERLRHVVSDLTPDKLILNEAAKGSFCALFVVVNVLIIYAKSLQSLNAELVAHLVNTALHNVKHRQLMDDYPAFKNNLELAIDTMNREKIAQLGETTPKDQLPWVIISALMSLVVVGVVGAVMWNEGFS
ncbi:MAG: hypothetical protein JJ964_14505 [Rhizobiales bacterium]|nr:hypothetical protein [Hyphomicrobiales bacterium]